MRYGAVAFATIGVLVVLAGSSEAVGPNGVAYTGVTDQDREIKLVTGTDGLVRRGALSVVTACAGRFKPFVAAITFDRPLDRSDRRGFREHGNDLDTDGTYSGRYKYEIEGKRKSKRKFKGEFDLEIVFRKDGREYTTCVAKDVAYKVKRSARGNGRYRTAGLP